MSEDLVTSHKKFRRGGEFETQEEAEHGERGSYESKYRMGKAKLDAKELAKRVAKEKDY